MPKLLFIILLLIGLISQVNVARAQQQSNITRHTQQVLPPYQPMNESEWNEVKKEISDSTLKLVDKICAQKMIVLSLISRDSVKERELDLLYAKQRNLAKGLKEIANTSEIKLLGNHPNGIVRYYAVSLLMSQSITARYANLYKHLNDTEYIPIDNDPFSYVSIDSTKARVGDLLYQCYNVDINPTGYFYLYDNNDEYSPNYKIQQHELFFQVTNDLIRTPNFLYTTYHAIDIYYYELFWYSKADSLKYLTDTRLVKEYKELVHQAIHKNNDAALAYISKTHHYMIGYTDFVGLREMYKNLNDTVIVAIFEYLDDQNAGTYGWLSKEDDWYDWYHSTQKNHSYVHKMQDRLIAIIKKHCTVDDLKKLLHHPYFSIQSCVFNILLEDKSFDPIKHLKSIIKLANNQNSFQYPDIYSRIYSFAKWSSQKLKYPKKAELDSLIFYAPFYIYGFEEVIEKIPPTPYYRARILELAKEDRYRVKEEAILKLAEYQNLADTSFFIVHKKHVKKGELDFVLNVSAIQKFRHPYFLLYVKKMFHYYLKEDLRILIDLIYLYPDPYFLPYLKSELLKRVKKNEADNITRLLDILLCYARTPHCNQAKAIAAIVYQYNQKGVTNKEAILVFKEWGFNFLTNKYAYRRVGSLISIENSEFNTLFQIFYDKQEFENITWSLWAKNNIVTYNEYGYFKNKNKERCLKLAQQTLVNVLIDRNISSSKNLYQTTDERKNPLIAIALDLSNENNGLPPEFLPIIKNKLNINLSKQHEIDFPLNLLIFYTGTPQHNQAKKIAELAYHNNLPDPTKFSGIIKFINRCTSLNKLNIKMDIVDVYYNHEVKNDKRIDSLFLNFYTTQEVDSILWWIWKNEDALTEYAYAILSKINKTKALKYAEQTIVNLINDRSNKYYYRLFRIPYPINAHYNRSIKNMLSDLDQEYPKFIFKLLDNELSKPIPSPHFITSIYYHYADYNKVFLDRLIRRVKTESNKKVIQSLLYTIGLYINSDIEREKLVKTAYTNNQYFKNNKKAQVTFEGILYQKWNNKKIDFPPIY